MDCYDVWMNKPHDPDPLKSEALERRKHYRSRAGAVLIIVGMALGLVAIGLFVQSRHGEPEPPPGAVQTAAKSSVKPSTTQIASYNVSPDLPKYIAIPNIGLRQSRIIQLGLVKNEITVPDNIYDAGWYDGSSKPGQPGAMFIYGHVSSWKANGIFYNLKKLRPGNTITITRGDNTTYTYQVVSSKVYSYNSVNMQEVLSPVDAGKPGLNLMTCIGQVIKGTSEFNERLVVFASLVN